MSPSHPLELAAGRRDEPYDPCRTSVRPDHHDSRPQPLREQTDDSTQLETRKVPVCLRTELYEPGDACLGQDQHISSSEGGGAGGIKPAVWSERVGVRDVAKVAIEGAGRNVPVQRINKTEIVCLRPVLAVVADILSSAASQSKAPTV